MRRDDEDDSTIEISFDIPREKTTFTYKHRQGLTRSYEGGISDSWYFIVQFARLCLHATSSPNQTEETVEVDLVNEVKECYFNYSYYLEWEFIHVELRKRSPKHHKSPMLLMVSFSYDESPDFSTTPEKLRQFGLELLAMEKALQASVIFAGAPE